MKDKEKIEAMQNLAVCASLIGLIIAARAKNVITFLVGVLLIAIGSGTCLAGEYALDRIRKDKQPDSSIEEILNKIDKL